MDNVGTYDLTAVDILLNPDETMLALAKQVNARMLTSVPPVQKNPESSGRL